MKFEKHTVGIYLRFGKKSQIDDDKADERKQIKNRKKKIKKTS